MQNLVATAYWWTPITWRRLYSMDKYSIKPNVFQAFSSRDPAFNRDDIADRSMIFYFDKKPKHISDSDFYNNLDLLYSNILSWICLELQKLLWNLENIEDPPEANFRNFDFYRFVYNINKDKVSEDNMISIFNRININQKSFSNEWDIILEILESIFKNPSQELILPELYYTSNELHSIFSSYSHNLNLKSNLPNIITLWRHLGWKLDSYIETNWIKIEKHKSNNKYSYRIFKV